MRVANLRIQAVAFKNDSSHPKKIVQLAVEQALGEDDSLEIFQMQGLITNLNTAPRKTIKSGTPEHQLMTDLKEFFERWCEEHNPFE